MERIMTVEERIRRAEERYEQKKRNEGMGISTVKKEVEKDKKDLKLLKKMVIQLIICTLIYLVVYTIQNNEYIFSQDFINKVNEIISYDINFKNIYEQIKEKMKNSSENKDNGENSDSNQENNLNEENQNGIGGAQENIEENKEENEEENEQSNQNENLSEEEQEILKIKNTANFIKPIDGTISSSYGLRENATGRVPKNHTGIDIAAVTGTKIKAATDGEVVMVSEEGDYGKHIKMQIGEVSVIYAHCNNIYVKEGDKITQGQEIAEVGSTGNSTGPHLHFEIRISEKTVDPQKIVEL